MAVFCGARLRVVVLCGRGSLAVLGCEFLIWVAGCEWSWIIGCALWSWIVGCAGLRICDMGYGLQVVVLGYGWLFRFLGSAMERQRRESQIKYYYFFYNTCYSAILCLELHCSSIAKKFAILLFSILQ